MCRFVTAFSRHVFLLLVIVHSRTSQSCWHGKYCGSTEVKIARKRKKIDNKIEEKFGRNFLLTLEATLDALRLIIGTHAISRDEALALVLFDAQSSDPCATLLDRIYYNSINHCEMNHWKNYFLHLSLHGACGYCSNLWREGCDRDDEDLTHEKVAPLSVKRRKLFNVMLTAILCLCAFWTNNYIIFFIRINWISISQQNECEKGRSKHQI